MSHDAPLPDSYRNGSRDPEKSAILEGLEYDGRRGSMRNESLRTLRMLSKGLREGNVKVWGLKPELVERLPDMVSRIADLAESDGDRALALQACDVLRKLNVDNAKILAMADRLAQVDEGKVGPDPSTAPRTVIVVQGDVVQNRTAQ